MIEHWIVVVWSERGWDTYSPPDRHWNPFHYDVTEAYKLRERLIAGGYEPREVQVIPINLPCAPKEA